jgi:flagellar biosynthetic protein FliR
VDQYSLDVLAEFDMGLQGGLTFDLAWLTTVFLLSLRLAGLFMMTPVFGAMGIPRIVRVLFIASLGVALASGFPQWRAPADLGFAGLMLAGASELMLGATMALGILIAFAAFSVGGRILDVQIGFGIAQIFDPVTKRNMPIVVTALSQIAIVVFFTTDGHHALLRGLAYSLDRFPPGQFWPMADAASAIIKQVAAMFSFGFALVAPVIFCLLLVELGLAVLARNLPQFNMFAMGIPVKIIVGLLALSLWIVGMGGVMSRTYASIFSTWEGVFR